MFTGTLESNTAFPIWYFPSEECSRISITKECIFVNMLLYLAVIALGVSLQCLIINRFKHLSSSNEEDKSCSSADVYHHRKMQCSPQRQHSTHNMIT